MIVKLLCVAGLLAAPVPASAPELQGNPIPTVICPVKGGFIMGTAFRIGPKLLLSVNHVTNRSPCYVDGDQIKVVYAPRGQDFSILSVSKPGPFLPIDCGGYVRGRSYIALGHPRGVDDLIPVPLVATGIDQGGQALLTGIFEVQPGHSGAPILDAETHKVVGVVNAADWEQGITTSVALKDTAVCSKS